MAKKTVRRVVRRGGRMALGTRSGWTAPAVKADPAGLMDQRLTLAHVTHEAVEQLGGIGSVLEGMISSPVYQANVKRSILIGPTSAQLSVDPQQRLGEAGEVLYSSIDGIDQLGLAGKFRPVEWAFNVAIVYGRRHYKPAGQDRQGEAEVLLIDVFRINTDRLNRFKYRLAERFGLESWRYDSAWDYEEYVRLAEPTFYALLAILHREDLPCLLVSHEFMGMPAALGAIMDGPEKFRTIFHAHECATARRLVEDHPGHDTMFYNVLRQARQQGLYMRDVFGDMDGFFRHALIRRTHLCDGLIAVGDWVAQEFHFLGLEFEDHPIDVVYNGLPVIPTTPASKKKSRQMLADYAQMLLGWRPDVLMTHVTRPVVSKAIWRDLAVCHELDGLLGGAGRKGVLFILTTGGGVRRPQDVLAMEKSYGWPRVHRVGYPDLVGPEVGMHQDIEAFNARHENVQVVLVNQFGWSRSRIGARLPAEMTMADLRRATDVEFGMAVYEPFGISPLEPLSCGAICVISSVCGCACFVEHAAGGRAVPNVLVSDFTKLDRSMTIEDLKAMGRADRDAIEAQEAKRLAAELMRRLPWSERARQRLVESGQRLVRRMGWDQVLEWGMLPLLERIRAMPATDINGREAVLRKPRS